jgi:hypothetical protein
MTAYLAYLLGRCRRDGDTSVSCAAKRTATSPSSQRTSSRLTRSLATAVLPSPVAFVLKWVRVEQWIKSVSLAARAGR